MSVGSGADTQKQASISALTLSASLSKLGVRISAKSCVTSSPAWLAATVVADLAAQGVPMQASSWCRDLGVDAGGRGRRT
eukprot:2869979-Prorocentrum_lima.AAC.1